ncbi:TPA: hypothetical protein J4P89_003803 [Escherichia coli]|uniref:hypothetical protein n=1 Tax=Escherichia coli TaxID=562 RepID=UPI0006812A9D|nr:hypothetical protein [Escherichia coli]EFN9269318.1 hypothetical protein [Escherichia coli]EIG1294999.1 hypothetical protein [Escherichia coli]KNF79655.1 hypothetical protein WQ89_13830 [Escherichia coli]MCV9097352.1 hypothetical protein [Escherichia coli]HBA6045805.1 hypothetical protein [Escherichia coli]
MAKFLDRIAVVSGKFMQMQSQPTLEQTSNNKITTDANGNATLNMRNKQVQSAMLARMRELAAKR